MKMLTEIDVVIDMPEENHWSDLQANIMSALFLTRPSEADGVSLPKHYVSVNETRVMVNESFRELTKKK